VNGDGIGDIVVGAGPGSPGGEVKVFNGADLSQTVDFFPFVPEVTNGVNVRLIDGNGDGRLDIYVSLQGAGFPILSAFDGTTGTSLALGGFGGDGTNTAGPDNGDAFGGGDGSGGGNDFGP